MQTLQERYAPIRNGSVISAVDLIRGIGVCAGLTPVEVEGSDGALRHQLRRQGRGRAAGAARRGFRLPAYRSERRGGPRRRRRTESTDDRSARRTGGAADLRSGPRMGVSRLAGHRFPTTRRPCLLRTPTAAPVPFTIWRAAAIPTWWGPTTNRVPDGAATATCGAMPSSTSSSTVPNNGRKNTSFHTMKYYSTNRRTPEVSLREAVVASMAPRQRALHTRTDRAAARRILRRDRPSGPPPDRLPRGRRLFRREIEPERCGHIVATRSASTFRLSGRRRHLGARTLPRPDDGLQAT